MITLRHLTNFKGFGAGADKVVHGRRMWRGTRRLGREAREVLTRRFNTEKEERRYTEERRRGIGSDKLFILTWATSDGEREHAKRG